ncbi:MAG: tetratricopeptide repeat protein [Verrucomicrobiales bacterium]
MFAFSLRDLWLNTDSVLSSPLLIIMIGFQLWMFVDAIRRREWIWAIFIFFFSIISAVLYYFFVYRPSAPVATKGFELPGTHKRERIKELQSQIYHLNKPHHHAELGDIYFQEGKLKEAEESYRKAIELDPEDLDFKAHLGQCLLRQNRPEEARPLLEVVCSADNDHDYGHTMMAYAETMAKLGHKDHALAAWKKVLEQHSYSRARVQYAELLISLNQKEEAKKELQDMLADESHSASFQAKRDKLWIKQAKLLHKGLS